MEEENRKLVIAARRAYSEEVRTLASKVQARDPRVLQRNLEVSREKLKKKQEEGVSGGGKARRVPGRAGNEAAGARSVRDEAEEVEADVEARERRERDKERERTLHEQQLDRLLAEMLEEEAAAAARAQRSSRGRCARRENSARLSSSTPASMTASAIGASATAATTDSSSFSPSSSPPPSSFLTARSSSSCLMPEPETDQGEKESGSVGAEEDARHGAGDGVQEAQGLPVPEHGIEDDEAFVQVFCECICTCT